MKLRLDFEWDDAKARSNAAKHGISFEEAIAVFGDDDAVILDATRDTDGESRSKIIGRIEGRLITVVFTGRGTAKRIISARRANRQEERSYGDR